MAKDYSSYYFSISRLTENKSVNILRIHSLFQYFFQAKCQTLASPSAYEDVILFFVTDTVYDGSQTNTDYTLF